MVFTEINIIKRRMVKKSDNPLNAMINREFLIRWHQNDKPGSFLVSAGQYHKIVGEEMRSRHFHKVLNGGLDRYTFLIRNRLKIEFISK